MERVARGHSDRCGTCAAAHCLQEGRTRGERNIAELQEERRQRSWVCKGELGKGKSIKKVEEIHVVPLADVTNFSYSDQKNRKFYPEPGFVIFKKIPCLLVSAGRVTTT